MSVDAFETDELPVVDLDDQARPAPPAARSPRGQALRRLAAVPRILTWTGLVLTLVGFALIAVAWGKVAALASVVAQLPYVVSAGVTGIGLVMVGLTLVSIDAKLADARLRREQARDMATRLEALVAIARSRQ